MPKVFAIAMLHMKTMLKSPAGIILMFIMPLVFSIIFGNMSGEGNSSKPIVLVVAGKDANSRQMVNLLKDNHQYTWEETTINEAAQRVKAQEAIAAVRIHGDMETRIKQKQRLFEVISQRKSQEYFTLLPFLEGAGRTAVASFEWSENMESGSAALLLERIGEREGVHLQKKVIQREGAQREAVSLMTIGFVLMFMMFGISGAASSILDERKAGTWQRLLVTPVSQTQILGGYLLSYFLMGWIQLAVLMVIMTLFFHAIWGNLLYFIPFASLIIILISGFGLMIAGLVKTSQQAGALNTVLIVSTCMLGGVYWPLEVVPVFMQQIAKAVPQSWMMLGLREIISGSLHSATLVKSAFILLGFSVVFYAVGISKVKFH
ncbi:ABC transporter permease [Bacillus sp. FJAT-27251]|uniref:ABC transporter permease n=1 Tax=Bacillus sp. FJAT-27251 TaxID=1684142 RepID=UPI0006A762DF|nr:ABC transporter permease [Bacillus sp. FJAT-27251]